MELLEVQSVKDLGEGRYAATHQKAAGPAYAQGHLF